MKQSHAAPSFVVFLGNLDIYISKGENKTLKHKRPNFIVVFVFLVLRNLKNSWNSVVIALYQLNFDCSF